VSISLLLITYKLQEQNAELEKAVESYKTSAALAIQSKESVEREAEQLYKQWNEYVKNKADEFALIQVCVCVSICICTSTLHHYTYTLTHTRTHSPIQSSMVPSKELEMLRVQMAEELEFPHRQKVEVSLCVVCGIW
jgi:Zn-finger nucleic acid-binding protein